uniref:ZP domain-containing protein n=1 Tax=Neolamprologus brichardi TaxID=32507 RepID=A0A3Q4GGF5_NEOBR
CRHWISRVFFVVLHSLYFEGRGIATLQMQCGENKVRIAEKHQFSQDRRIPFSPQCFQLGENLSQETCRPKEAVSEAEMVISAGLRECGTESSVKISSAGTLKGLKSKFEFNVTDKRQKMQKVSREPLSLTWVPMTSTVSVFGLQHFSLHILADVCTSQCSSTPVEALMHPPVTVYVDSCVFITNQGCHLMATLKQSLHSKLEQTCFFHRPTFSLEGDSELCECCSNLSAGDTRLSWRQVGHPFTNTIYIIVEVVFTSCSKCNIVSVVLVCSGIC